MVDDTNSSNDALTVDSSSKEEQELDNDKKDDDKSHNSSVPDTNDTTTPRNSYLEMVAAKRARNEAMIQQLGIPQLLKKKPSKKTSSTSKKSSQAKPEPVRVSSRIRKKPAEYAKGLTEFGDEPVGRGRRSLRSQRRRVPSPRQMSKESPRESSPTAVQQEALQSDRAFSKQQQNGSSNRPSSLDWLDDLRHYLVHVDGISPSNVSRVMSQVIKLADGRGIGYRRWPSNVVFAQGSPVHPATTDLDALYETAMDYETQYGRDLGNGWLLAHPIQKLIQFEPWWKEFKQKGVPVDETNPSK